MSDQPLLYIADSDTAFRQREFARWEGVVERVSDALRVTFHLPPMKRTSKATVVAEEHSSHPATGQGDDLPISTADRGPG